jgi:hypothetical protein
LVTGLLQEGSMTGVLYFITPTWEKLLDIQVGTRIRATENCSLLWSAVYMAAVLQNNFLLGLLSISVMALSLCHILLTEIFVMCLIGY